MTTYRVRFYRDWSSTPGVEFEFTDESEARAFAATRPEPLIDLVERNGRGVIAVCRNLAHPTDRAFMARDDFPAA